MKVSSPAISLHQKMNSWILFRVWIIVSIIIMFCFGFTGAAVAQASLTIPKKGEYKLEQDTLVLSELIIGDSAKIILTKPTSMIKVRSMVIGVNIRIMGLGEIGIDGKDGRHAAQPDGACRPGRPGETAKPGTPGGPGKDFTLEVDQLTIESSMVILNLAGGNGGDGGTGGDGSQGSNSTAACLSNGGNGGNGGSGADGGRGGTLTLVIRSNDSKELLKKFNLYNRGGYRGVGGKGGSPGTRGQGSSKESKLGVAGKVGTSGNNGVDGRPLFYSINSQGDNPVAMAASSK